MTGVNIFKEFIQTMPHIVDTHKRGSDAYNLLQKLLRKEIELLFLGDARYRNLQPFGVIDFPYHKMGNVDTLNLFDLDEIIIFSFYYHNRDRYKKVADLGANLGLHSIIMSLCGFEVVAFEPDDWHFGILEENIKNNQCANVTLHRSAVSDKDGEVAFTRVLGNTTSSHIAGDKTPYGELESIKVKTYDFSRIIQDVDFMKIDVEGHEVVLLCSTTHEDWEDTDAMVEISNKENAKAVFEHLSSIDVAIYAQKILWQKVERLEDMPESYKEGSLFISNKNRAFV